MNTEALYEWYLKSSTVSTDTRKLTPGCLFFALRGPNFNGNAFAAKAIAAGALRAIIDDPAFEQEGTLLVPDALLALQQLAAYHRQQTGIPVVAITGSNGKTTTKELVSAVLAQKFRTWSTPGNLNNHIGVPLTLLLMPAGTEIAVVEMGDNQPGDVTALCQIARPDFGLITNIGKDHLEGFGGFEGNLRAKSEIFHYLIQHQGTAFVYSPDAMLQNMARRFKVPPVYYGSPDDFACLKFLRADPYIRYIGEQSEIIQTNLIGEYNFQNLQTAYCIGKHFGVPVQQIHEALKAYVPANNRSQVVETNGYLVISDAYNANPSSVEAALRSFGNMSSARPKVCILADMLELGTDSPSEHRAIIELVRSLPFEQTLFCGPLFLAQADRPEGFFADKASLAAWLSENLPPEAFVLLKGSRGMALETLLAEPPFISL